MTGLLRCIVCLICDDNEKVGAAPGLCSPVHKYSHLIAVVNRLIVWWMINTLEKVRAMPETILSDCVETLILLSCFLVGPLSY